MKAEFVLHLLIFKSASRNVEYTEERTPPMKIQIENQADFLGATTVKARDTIFMTGQLYV